MSNLKQIIKLKESTYNTKKANNQIDNDSLYLLYEKGIIASKDLFYGNNVIKARNLDSDLVTAITKALVLIDSPKSTVIDCTDFTGSISITSTITITKPCTILFGNARITSSAANFFDIQSDNVAIIGAGRHTDRTVVNSKDNATVFAMTGTGATLTNDSDKGYHIYSKGNKNLRFEYFTLLGVRTTLGKQCGNASYPINGCGGIHIDKANPIETGSGNTCNNIIINQVLIDGTKVHGIYISTPILTKISNVRLSQVAGHGIFLNGGTSVSLDNVYVASANLAGFCILGVTYCTLLNTVAEYVGIGYLIRGSFNVSIFSPGVEQTMNQTNNPWSDSQPITGKYGFNVQVTGTSGGSAATAIIPDVTGDFYNQFCGIPYYIQGGRNITLYTPYSTGICATNNYKGNASPAAPSRTCQLKIIGNARNVKVINLYGASINDNSGSIHNDIKIEGLSGSSPSGVEIDFNTGISLISNNWTKHVTNVSSDYAPVYNNGENVLIKNAGEIYYNDYEDDIVKLTWAELKTLRDNFQLIPGKFYRITDYVTTTVQTNTQSAGNQFDIIVRADSSNVLNENATAALHENDTYFSTAGAKLEAWELKYCLDNDTNRFAWADSTNGKGVIWWMKDDNDNECYYDFKNIMFKVGAKSQAGTIDNVYYYTFSFATGTNDSSVTDHSLNGSRCYKNSIGKNIVSKLQLTFNVFRNSNSYSSCYSNTFGDSCYNNTFGDTCYNNTFGNNCYLNTFGNNCSNNIFGNNCSNNFFGNNCYFNTFGNSCSYIRFGAPGNIKSYYRYIIIENGNNYINLDCSTTSGSNYLQNIKIVQGVNNTKTRKNITHPTTNDTFQTEYKPANSQTVLI